MVPCFSIQLQLKLTSGESIDFPIHKEKLHGISQRVVYLIYL